MGVVSALLKYFGADWFASGWNASRGAEVMGVVMYIAIIVYFIWDSLRAKPEKRIKTMEFREQLLERFLRYVAIDTQSDPDSETFPSRPNNSTC